MPEKSLAVQLNTNWKAEQFSRMIKYMAIGSLPVEVLSEIIGVTSHNIALEVVPAVVIPVEAVAIYASHRRIKKHKQAVDDIVTVASYEADFDQ